MTACISPPFSHYEPPQVEPLAPHRHNIEILCKGGPGDNMLDSYGRTISYMRVSVTDRCNMRCVYCSAGSGEFFPENELLTKDEFIRVVRVASAAGVKKVRLTGGEPLARGDIVDIVSGLASLGTINDLSITTNGLMLENVAEKLATAGIGRVNVSLDTLKPDRFAEICRAGNIDKVLSGIRTATESGLAPVKINVVVMRGRNDDEINDFLDFSIKENVIVRFIEYMPLSRDEDWKKLYVPRDELLERAKGRLVETQRANPDPSSPARYFNIDGSTTSAAGFISPVSHNFCSHCNRLRLTPDGRILACLMGNRSVDLKPFLRGSASDEELLSALENAVLMKGEKGKFLENSHRSMHSIGG